LYGLTRDRRETQSNPRMISDERERARARSVARTALAIFTPPLTASGDDDGARTRRSTVACYYWLDAVATWVAIG